MYLGQIFYSQKQGRLPGYLIFLGLIKRFIVQETELSNSSSRTLKHVLNVKHESSSVEVSQTAYNT